MYAYFFTSFSLCGRMQIPIHKQVKWANLISIGIKSITTNIYHYSSETSSPVIAHSSAGIVPVLRNIAFPVLFIAHCREI